MRTQTGASYVRQADDILDAYEAGILDWDVDPDRELLAAIGFALVALAHEIGGS